MERQRNITYRTKATDVDEKGIVTVAVNGIGVKDAQGDISQPGSFTKTLKENIGRMRWFLNHRVDQLLGVPLEGKEEDGNLVMTGALNLNKQMGRDILEDYKLYAENGRTLEHSIGVSAVKRDASDPAKVLEWKMYEYSTLTGWGANPQTFLVDIKSATPDDIRGAMDFVKMAAERRYSDERLKRLEESWDILNKALTGARMVTCPYCGTTFDYDQQREYTFTQQVQDCAAQYASWIMQDCVQEEMDKLEPEIAEQVSAIIQALVGTATKDGKEKITKKSIEDMMTYVRCPHCWSRIYRATLSQPEPTTEPAEPSEDTQPEEGQEKARRAVEDTLFKTLNGAFK